MIFSQLVVAFGDKISGEMAGKRAKSAERADNFGSVEMQRVGISMQIEAIAP